MHLYMSGTPRNDPYQSVENRMCTHRLFSMHAEYEKPVLRWVRDLRDGILDADAYLKAYPQHRDLIKERDIKRRAAQAEWGRKEDWETHIVLERVCKRLEGRPYPKTILLDSGAFTAWNKGEKTTVDDVKRKYSSFMEAAGDLFDEIWMINLDVIPGERGRDPTEEELKEAVRVSDINFKILVEEFGDRVLPVFHQGEDPERLEECVAQVDGRSNYICISPRNDLPEGKRVDWSRDSHGWLHEKYPHIMTHGLATTGNRMVRSVPWYSGDSAAWVQHGGYGMIDIFHEPGFAGGPKKQPHYMNYFVSFENVEYDLSTEINGVSGLSLGIHPNEMNKAKIAEAFLEAGIKPDEFPTIGGHVQDLTKHYNRLDSEHATYIRGRVEALGFPFEICRWDSRVRNLICMAEFVSFAEWAESADLEPVRQELFGGF